MTTEQNKAVLQRWVEAFNAKDITLLDRLADGMYTSSYTLHDPAFPDFGRGPESVKQFVNGLFQANSEAHMTVEDVFGEGDKLAYRLLIQVTDATTGKKVSLPVLVISRFVGGKFAEEWEIAGPPVADESAGTSAAQDPAAVVKALDEAVNAGDIDRVMAFFAEDAVLKSPMDAHIYTGKQQIREWFEPQMHHFHVDSRNHVVTGNAVTWEGGLSGDIPKQMGSSIINEVAEAIMKDGKIISFTLIIASTIP